MKRFLFVPLLFQVALLTGCGGGDQNGSSATTPAPDANAFAIAKGRVIYNRTCIACHGEGGEGIEGLGKDWTESDYIATSTDAELIAFIKEGRTLDDPRSAGNAIMPPKGGDLSLTDEDLAHVVAFMRTLQD